MAGKPRWRRGLRQLVVGGWIHLERMNDRQWWMRLGGIDLWITISAKGKVEVTRDGKPL